MSVCCIWHVTISTVSKDYQYHSTYQWEEAFQDRPPLPLQQIYGPKNMKIQEPHFIIYDSKIVNLLVHITSYLISIPTMYSTDSICYICLESCLNHTHRLTIHKSHITIATWKIPSSFRLKGKHPMGKNIYNQLPNNNFFFFLIF